MAGDVRVIRRVPSRTLRLLAAAALLLGVAVEYYAQALGALLVSTCSEAGAADSTRCARPVHLAWLGLVLIGVGVVTLGWSVACGWLRRDASDAVRSERQKTTGGRTGEPRGTPKLDRREIVGAATRDRSADFRRGSLGCGAVLGLVVGLRLALGLAGNGSSLANWIVAAGVVLGGVALAAWASFRFGDRFWNSLRHWLWWI
jgi:hypothetical protein